MTLFTKVRHGTLCWSSYIQSPSHSTCLRSIWNVFSYISFPTDQIGVAVTHCTCIWEVIGSNLDRHTGCTNWWLSLFFSVSPGWFRDSTSITSHPTIRRCIAYILETSWSNAYCHVRGVCVTNNNGFWIGWLDLLALLLQLQPIITAHNQWPSKTRSIPYWTTNVLSSTGTNDERRLTAHSFYCDCLERWLSYECRRIELSWTELSSRWPEYRSLPRTIRVILFFRCHETCLPNRCPAIDYSVSIRCSGNVCLASRWLLIDFRSDSNIPAFRRCLPNRCLAMVIFVTI
jgi:hypothetical protein